MLVIPIHDNIGNGSFNKNTPSNAAVNGSAKLKVTAAEGGILCNPYKNNTYASDDAKKVITTIVHKFVEMVNQPYPSFVEWQ